MPRSRTIIDREYETTAVLREYSPLTRWMGKAAVGIAIAASTYAFVSGAVAYREAYQPHDPTTENLPPAEAPEIPDVAEQQRLISEQAQPNE